MSAGDSRLGLFPALSATERVGLVLQALKEGQEPSPRITGTMPLVQYREYNRLIARVRCVNSDLAMVVELIRGATQALQARLGWLAALHGAMLRSRSVALYLEMWTAEPVTETEHAALVAAERERWAPVAELAEFVVERKEDWDDADLEAGEGGEPVLSDAAWERAVEAQSAALGALVASGVLVGRGSGRRLKIKVGSFHDWLGEEVELLPEFGNGYGVVPDEDAHLVDVERRWRAGAREALEQPPPGLVMAVLGDEPASWPALLEAMAAEIAALIDARWREVAALDRVLAGVAAELGDDPAVPSLREKIEALKAELQGLHEHLGELGGPFEFSEVGDEEIAAFRELLDLVEAEAGGR